MKKKFCIILCMIVFTMMMVPARVMAANHPLSNGEVLDISTCAEGDTVTIAAGATVGITGSRNNIRINCGAGVTLGIYNVVIDDSSIADACPLAFSGSGNILEFMGNNTLKAGNNEPGIKAEGTTQLEIHGVGSLSATGGGDWGGAGIGGGFLSSGGKITINSGKISAQGGNGGAGIGGCHGSGGTITINGGIVTAQGGESGAGIGGGYDGSGGSIVISGTAHVTAIGGWNSAGIGGGHTGDGGNITISGTADVSASTATNGAGIGGGCWHAGGRITISEKARVTAAGGGGGAGIGSGGYQGGGGTVSITGGTVYATRGSVAPYDIGCGSETTSGTLSISGDAAVFLRNERCITPSTAHTYETITAVADDKVYGVSANGWTPVFGVYMVPSTLSYNACGGGGTVPGSVTQHKSTMAAVGGGGGLTRTGGTFTGWNTEDGGGGDDYAPGSMFTFSEDMTLYAVWDIPVTGLTVSGGADTILDNETLQLSADVDPDDTTYPTVWTSSDADVATVDASGLVTAHLPGRVTITATAGSFSDTHSLTVNPHADGSYDIGKYGNNSVITLGESLSAVTLANGSGTTWTNMQIDCGAGIALTLNGVKINDATNDNACPLSFSGSGNALILSGSSSLKAGRNEPGIRVEGGTALNISGTGSLSADGGSWSAGIGGGYRSNGGTISINGGTVSAQGGYSGAGVGGGYCGNGGSTAVSGTARVTAKGGAVAAGIGGGVIGGGGTIDLSGGIVFAQRGDSSDVDIGYGQNGSGGALSISGDAVVFMRTNTCISAETTTHTRYGLTGITGGKLFGVPMPEGWTSAGAFIIPVTLTYNINGGRGTAPGEVMQPAGTSIPVADDSMFSRGDYIFDGWDTLDDELSATYAPGDTFTFTENTTLYAIWYMPVTGIGLSDTALTMTHHDKANLTTDIDPPDATYPEVTWESDHPEIASVDGTGEVTAMGVGTAHITATADGVTETCVITVEPKRVTGVGLSDAAITVIHHDKATLTTNVEPMDATYPDVTWESDHPELASVDDTGEVTAVGVGTAHITATADGVTETCLVAVEPKRVTSVGLSDTAITIIHHGKANLAADIDPADATYPQVTWESDHPEIAAVDDTGEVTAVDVGTAHITATADGVTETCVVTVEPKRVASVGLSDAVLFLIHHDKANLTTNIDPADATYPDVTWQSDHPEIASVDDTGEVTAMGVGTANITATADGVTETCIVTVEPKHVTSLSLSDTAITMIHHDTVTLTTNVAPPDATYPDVTWKSDRPEIASVDAHGVVTAEDVGITDIIVTADGVTETCVVTVEPKRVTAIGLSDTSLTMIHHDTAVLTTAVEPADATYPEVRWDSDDTSVVTVDQSGLVTAVGLGQATIIAMADGISEECLVTVSPKHVAGVTLNKTSESLHAGDTLSLSAKVSPADATYPNVKWTSSDPAVAAVDRRGTVTAACIGCTTITATADGRSASCTVTVEPVPVISIRLDRSSAALMAGDTITLSATVLPDNADCKLTWASGNPGIATVDQNGRVTAVAQGHAVIVARAGGISAACAVTVNPQTATSITLDSTSEVLTVGGTVTLNAVVEPAGRDISWTSSDAAVATVDGNGTVTAIGEGSAIIMATADGISAACGVTVRQKMAALTGTLLDRDGSPLAGYTVELHSDPLVTVTDEEGRFTFTDVPVGDHTLTVKDPAGDTLQTFTVSLRSGDAYDYEQDGSAIDVALAADTETVEMALSVGEGIVDIADEANAASSADIPEKGNTNWYLWIIIPGMLLVGLIAYFLVYARRKKTV